MRTVADCIARCKALKGKWGVRNGKFRDWYDVLKLKDVLEQEGMESVTSNDPRTGYNLGRHLLVSSTIAHKIPSEELEAEELAATSYMESYIFKRWLEHEQHYRQIGKQGWLWHLISWMMATGWYAVFSMVEPDKIWSEVWSPAEVFPEFGDEGLIEVAHIYPLTASAANRKARKMGWQLRVPFTSNTYLYNHWGFDIEGDVANAVVLGTEFVKTPAKEPALSKIDRLPIFISPVGGLPDMGSIEGANEWQKHFGEFVGATNEGLAKNYDKMLTFAQQMVRDVANPRWFETSSGDTPILTPENLFKRGAIFRGGLGDVVTPLPVPPIPVELRTSLFDYQNMLQRGLFPWVMHGNIQQQISYLAMANIAAAGLQILTPYRVAINGLLSDIDNYWTEMMRRNNYRPHNFELPENLPEDVEFQVEADIEIPGYLIQRATVARMLDPTFRLKTTTVMDKLFPEIKDPMREQAGVRTEDAMMHPKAIIIDQIIAYREQARLLRDAKDPDSAALYEKLAKALEAELEAPTPPPAVGAPGAPTPTPREVMPAEFTTPPEGMERI